MDSQSMTRKDFITLTITLVGGAAVAAGCSSTSNSGAGTGGATGSGGATGAGTGGRTGSDGGPDVRADATADTANSCADPLPATQASDATGHTHTLEVPAATLAETTTTTLLSGPFPVGTSGAHFHQIMLTAANLATLRSAGAVTVTSTSDGAPIHSHMFMVSCH